VTFTHRKGRSRWIRGMHVNMETQMSYIVTSERTMSPTGLYLLFFS